MKMQLIRGLPSVIADKIKSQVQFVDVSLQNRVESADYFLSLQVQAGPIPVLATQIQPATPSQQPDLVMIVQEQVMAALKNLRPGNGAKFSGQCFRCGKIGHRKDKCSVSSDVICGTCNKKGHTSLACGAWKSSKGQGGD